MKHLYIAAIAGLLAGPALASDAGDAEKGKKAYNKCKSCHVLADGDEIIVKGGKTGPNLFGVIGRPVASMDFKYGKTILAVGESGAVWDFDSFTAYVQDPKAWLKEQTGDTAAKSKMSFKLKKGGEDIYAYLVSIAPPAEEAPAEEEEAAASE